MKLLLIINGKKEKLLHNNFEKDFEIIKIDEKELSKFQKLTKLIKKGNYSEVWFGTIQMNLQRFQFFILLYIFLTTKKGKIIDEYGKEINYSFFGSFLAKLFRLIPEILFTGFVLVVSNIYLIYSKSVLLKKN